MKGRNLSLGRKIGVVSAGLILGFALQSRVQAAVPFASAADLSASSRIVAVALTDEDTQGALGFVKSTAESGLTFLSEPNSTMDQKKKEFKKLLDNSFDLDTIARFSLGRYWNSASPQQQSEYTTLFKKMVVEVYANRFGDYKGQDFEVKSVRSVGSKDAMVTSYIIPQSGDNIQVDWRVRKTGNVYKIVDVYVAGVSMSVTQRSDFSSVIQRGGGSVDVLIDYLKEKF